MNELTFCLLSDLQRPLLARFYRDQQSPMRARGEGQLWVARRGAEIVAGMNLSAAAEGYWLTGLLVAPTNRRAGIGHRLVDHVLNTIESPVWLFCDPALLGFYEPLGFAETARVPPILQGRLERYRRSKSLLAMSRLMSPMRA